MTVAASLPRRAVLADLIPGERVRDIGLVLGGAALTGMAAQVSVHTSLSPVPFTLQTLAVLTVGASLGPVRGGLALLTYLLAGGVGLPWFAHHGHGFGGPTFGYVIGFVVAAVLTGALAWRGADRSVLGTVAIMALGTTVVYAIGTPWLAASLHLDAATAFRVGVRPFLVTDAIKVGLAALAFPAAWRQVRR